MPSLSRKETIFQMILGLISIAIMIALLMPPACTFAHWCTESFANTAAWTKNTFTTCWETIVSTLSPYTYR